jgi:hypothetical protein
VRHLRMVGLCLIAVFAVGATAVVVSPAYASCNTECKETKEKEKAEAKVAKEEAKEAVIREKREASGLGDPWGVNDFRAYKHCPYTSEAVENCFTGVTLGGKKGGFFQKGRVKVNLSKTILLQGGFNGENAETKAVPAVGAETLEAPPLPVEGGISVIESHAPEWPQGLKEAFTAAKKNKETEIDAKIEMAGNACFEEVGCLNTQNILFEQGIAFKLPLKVKLTGPFLEKLGGGPCYIGSDEHPIHINLTTEGAGASGHVLFNQEFTNIILAESRLVDVGWTIEEESGPKGCGGEYEPSIDTALVDALEIHPGKTGIVVLEGNLHDAGTPAVIAEAEKGKV